jgi:hypothetical protein
MPEVPGSEGGPLTTAKDLQLSKNRIQKGGLY